MSRIKFTFALLLFFSLNVLFGQAIQGELKKWHKVTLVFEGPETSEQAKENPFLNYGLNVTFVHTGTQEKYTVPGYFAGDGDAGNTGAESGNVWKVHFTPPETGEWSYTVDFKKGKWAAVRTSEKIKSAEFMDGETGTLTIGSTDKSGRDFRGKGMLNYVGGRYLKFQNGEYFLPELMVSGDILAAIANKVKPYLDSSKKANKGDKVVLGTVAGDIHDIAKDIVAFILDINGFDVVDLGVDVPVNKFVAAVQEHQAKIVGLSGFLTLAIEPMRETVSALKEAGFTDVKVMIGGGPTNELVCDDIGADGWGANAMDAVSLASKWAGVSK